MVRAYLYVHMCVAQSTRARARIGWRVNRTLAPRRRLREARPRAPAIERPPIPRSTLPTPSLVIPPCHLPTYRHPLALPSPFPSSFPPPSPGRLASSHPPFPVHPRTAIAHRHSGTTTTTTTTTPLTLIHTALNYGAYIGTYRYVHLYVHGHGAYIRAPRSYIRGSRTQLYLRMSWIYRARERSR